MKRLVALWAAFSIFGAAWGQAPYLLFPAKRFLEARNQYPLQDPKSPGANTLGNEPAEADSSVLQIVKYGQAERDGNTVRMSGGVEFIYRGYRTFADEAEGDLSTEVFTLRKNVKVVGADGVVYGELVTFNYKERSYVAENGSGTLAPSALSNLTTGDLYVRSERARGTERELNADLADCTSCDYEEPHFHFRSKSVTVRRGKRIILRNTAFYLLGYRIFNIPYLVIPLNDRQYNYLPEVGQSQDEGYFVKTRIALDVPGDNTLVSRVDYMTKLGAGLGGDYSYNSPNAAGALGIYGITGRSRTFNLTNNHRQRFKWGELGVDTDYQQNNYLAAPGTTLLSNRLQLNIPSRTGQTTIGFQRNQSRFSGSNSVNENLTINDSRRIGTRTNIQSDVSFTTTKNDFGVSSFSSRQADVRFQANQDFKELTGSVDYQRSIPIGNNPNFFSAGDRTPVVTLSTDSRRLHGTGRSFLFGMPYRTSLSVGELADLRNERQTRTSFDFQFNRSEPGNRRFRSDTNGSFRQGVYSDGTAQYVVQAGQNWSYSLGKGMAWSVRYFYNRPEGYTPILQDRSGNSHQVTTDLTAPVLPGMKFGFQTGYDFLRVRTSDVGWQQIASRIEYEPRSWINFRTLATYDTINQLWNSVRLDLTYRPGATFFGISARYDGFQQRWSNANLYLTNLKWGRTRFSAAASYNGFTKQFDATQLNFVYDLHCFELVANITDTRTGFRSGRDIQILFRIKAFPFNSSFGTGRGGQPFGFGLGGN